MWTLIILVHVGIWGKSDSLTNVTGFQSKETCEIAGRASMALVAGTKKEAVVVCVCVEVK